MNQQIKNGNAHIHSFLGATSYQLLHYFNFNLDKRPDTVVIHIEINDVLNSASNVNGLLSNIKDLIKNVVILVLNVFLHLALFLRRE